MMGNRQELFKQETVKASNVGGTLARLSRYFAPYWYMVLLALAVIILSNWMNVTTPELTGQATDCFIIPMAGSTTAFGDPSTGSGQSFGLAQSENSASACWLATTDPSSLSLTRQLIYKAYTWNDFPVPNASKMTNDSRVEGLFRLTIIMAVLFVAGALLFGLTFLIMTWAAQHVIRQLRLQVFEQLHRLSLSYYSEHTAGDLMSRITNDTSALEQGTSFALVQFISGIISLVWISYNMLSASLPFALLSLSVAPLMFIATAYFSAQARKAFRTSRKEIGNVNAELQESISAVREVQAFNRADENMEQFKEVNAANRDANVRAVSFTSALAPALEALSYVALAIVVGAGGWALLRGQTLFGATVTFGLVVTFLAYVQRFNQPIQQIAVLWTNIQNGIAGAERIFNILDEEPAVTDKPNAKTMPQIKGLVEFTNASHSYEDGVPVLKEVSFTAEPGKTIAIVGPTGAGKTTIINLLPRFYDVTSGSVKIDGMDVRDVTMKSLREQIGIVLQDTFLFSQSVMENVRFGRPDATDEEVMAAIKLANADSFIERLPEKYQTVLGERGSGLSQGQRQLLAIARAALSDPKILILDEATSSVDTRTERLIQKAFDELLKGRTAFVIAHRLSTIRNADMILVLKDGQIIERGKHDELLAKEGFYYDLYMSQFKKQEEMEVVA
jgi:ATP-binding cassette subfamily B protein